MPRDALDLSGQTFGRWTVIRRDGKIGDQSAFLCQCECGSRKRVRGPSLKSGGSLSCGCAGRERLGARARRHGAHGHPLYRTWVSMHDRCRRPNHSAFSRYGGRGIYVHQRWAEFSAFLEDMGRAWRPGLTLDRIDNDGPYSPWNCRWATKKQQSSNRSRKTIRAAGKNLTTREWAIETGIRPDLIRQRISRGWRPELAVTTPAKK